MSWLEAAAVVGDVAAPAIIDTGAGILGAGAITDTLLPSVLGDSAGVGALTGANGALGAGSTVAAGTTTGGVGAGLGSNAAALTDQTLSTQIPADYLNAINGVNPMVANGAANGVNLASAANGAGAGAGMGLSGAGSAAASPWAGGVYSGAYTAPTAAELATAANSGGAAASDLALTQAANAAPAAGGIMDYFSSALDWMKDNKTTTAIGAGMLASKLGLFSGKSNPGVDTTYRGILNDYKLNPDTFKPGGNANPTAITPPAYANYKNKPYASGGIVNMAMGGQPGQMYPQSQQDRTTFTPAPTLPNSMNNMMAGYDTPTDPMTGDISQRLASGGIAGYASGDLATTNDYLSMANTGRMSAGSGHHTDALMNELSQYANMATNPDPFNMGYGGAPGSSSLMGQGIVGNDDPDLRGKNAYQRAQIMNAKLASVANMQGQMAATPSTPALGAINTAPPQPTQTAASGGIMNAYASGGVPGGFNLGGYSDGGRLLRGSGDGMSDNIPATIAHKQPARLADGEFVVPADVVSHLGNGSTDAGAKRLYSMMDKVRQARTGSKKQGKEIKADKFLPT